MPNQTKLDLGSVTPRKVGPGKLTYIIATDWAVQYETSSKPDV